MRELVCVEHYHDRPQSFVSAVALAGLCDLVRRVTFVPATTRTTAQMKRVHFPGLPASRYQVVANGGVLLVDGSPDRSWARRVRRGLAASGASTAQTWQYLSRWRDEPWVRGLRTAEDLFCYALIDRTTLPADVLTEIRGWALARGWSVSLQGRKLYVVPATVNKESAVAEVVRRVDGRRVVAAGDSLLDRAMLVAADAGVRPGHGELAAQGWAAPHVTALEELGVVAGERIVDWMVEQALRQ